MQWYYQDETEGQTPFDENYIAALCSDKRIKPTTLVWNDTLSGWMPAAEAFPEAYPGAALPPSGIKTIQNQATAPKSNSLAEAESKNQLTLEPVKIKNQEVRELVRDIASYFAANRFWMNFFGILMILAGVIQALTLVGLLIAWLPIWSGVLLLKASHAAMVAEKTGMVETLESSVCRIALFFKINGIFALVVTLIYIAIAVWAFLFDGLALLSGLNGLPLPDAPFEMPAAQ